VRASQNHAEMKELDHNGRNDPVRRHLLKQVLPNRVIVGKTIYWVAEAHCTGTLLGAFGDSTQNSMEGQLS
jgi:hypothetical protein